MQRTVTFDMSIAGAPSNGAAIDVSNDTAAGDAELLFVMMVEQ